MLNTDPDNPRAGATPDAPPMTLVMTRPPLQTLDMASTQRATRRRTAYHAFDDENEAAQPVAKRAKVDAAKHINGKVNGETSKKAKPC